jgi:hypothetical protein
MCHDLMEAAEIWNVAMIAVNLGVHVLKPITAAARSKALNVFSPSSTGIVSSNPIQDMAVCLCYVAALRQADLQSKESYRLS